MFDDDDDDDDDQMAADEKLGRCAAEALLCSWSDEKGALMLKYKTISIFLPQIMVTEINIFYADVISLSQMSFYVSCFWFAH